MVFGLIDIILTMVVIISVLFALYRGLVRELLGIAAWLIAGFAALYSYAPMQPLMSKMFDNPTTAGIVGSASVALTVLIIMTLVNSWVAKKLRKSALSGLDRILGFAFGVARAGLLAAICYMASSMFMPASTLSKWESENMTMPYIHQIAGWLEHVVPENVMKDIHEYQGKVKELPPKKIGIDLKKTVKEELAEYRETDKQSLDDMIDEIAGE